MINLFKKPNITEATCVSTASIPPPPFLLLQQVLSPDRKPKQSYTAPHWDHQTPQVRAVHPFFPPTCFHNRPAWCSKVQPFPWASGEIQFSSRVPMYNIRIVLVYFLVEANIVLYDNTIAHWWLDSHYVNLFCILEGTNPHVTSLSSSTLRDLALELSSAGCVAHALMEPLCIYYICNTFVCYICTFVFTAPFISGQFLSNTSQAADIFPSLLCSALILYLQRHQNVPGTNMSISQRAATLLLQEKK